MAIKNYSYDYRQLSKVIYRTLLLGGNLPFHLTTMKLNLTKPLVIFDLETTGLDISKDRIIQISYIKVMPDGTEKRGNHLVNPERSLPQLVVELTSITDEMLADKPTFKQIAATLAHEFEGCDFAGFNSNRFDVPMLAEEFLRAGQNYDFSRCRLIDAQTIFHKMERRNLAAAYKFYCGRKMEDDFQAHLADQDTEATYRVLQGELDMYAPGKQEEDERMVEITADIPAADIVTNGNNTTITLKEYGLTFNMNASLNQLKNDKTVFYVQPTLMVGSTVESNVSKPEDFAFSSAVRTGTKADNYGNATIVLSSCTNTGADFGVSVDPYTFGCTSVLYS